MGPTVDNLDKLVRMPYGCGEQNMISTAPSVFVSEYLKSLTNPDAQLLATASRYIAIGMRIQLCVIKSRFTYIKTNNNGVKIAR